MARAHRLCLIMGLGWLVLAILCSIMPFHYGAWSALILAAVAPFAFLVCLRNVVRRRARALALAIPVVIVLACALYESSYPTTPGMDILGWMGLGLIGFLSVLLLQRDFDYEVTGLHKCWLIFFGLVWWTGWAVGVVNSPMRVTDSDVVGGQCQWHLKQIAVARQAYEDRFHTTPSRVDSLASAGLLDNRKIRCTGGRPYQPTSAWAQRTLDPQAILLVCPHHQGHLLVVTGEGAVLVYDQRRWKKHRLGPFEW